MIDNISEYVLDNKIEQARDPQNIELNANKSTSKSYESFAPNAFASQLFGQETVEYAFSVDRNNFCTNCEAPERLSQESCKEELENKPSQTYDEEIQSTLNLQICLVAEKMIRLQKLQEDLISYSSRQAYLYIISIAAKIEYKKRENNLFENSGFLLSSGNPRYEEFEDPTNFSFNFSDRSTNIRDVSDDLTFSDSSDLQDFDTQSQRALQSWFELFSRNS